MDDLVRIDMPFYINDEYVDDGYMYIPDYILRRGQEAIRDYIDNNPEEPIYSNSYSFLLYEVDVIY